MCRLESPTLFFSLLFSLLFPCFSYLHCVTRMVAETGGEVTGPGARVLD